MNTKLCILTLSLLTAAGAARAQNDNRYDNVRTTTGTRDMKEAFMTHVEDYKVASMAVRYAVGPWSEESEQRITDSKGERIPLGQGSWARLETNVPISIGGYAVEPGVYCLALQESEEGSWNLILFRDQDIRAYNVLPWQVNREGNGGKGYALEHEWNDEKAEVLTVSFEADRYEKGAGILRIRWGHRQWTAGVAMDLSKARPAGQAGNGF